MNTRATRGSAAVIAMIVLALTGLTVTAYVTSSTSSAAADAASVGGWRALYATDAGVAATIACVGSGVKVATMPPGTDVPTVSISGSKVLGFSFFSTWAQSERTVVARVTMGSGSRPVVSGWTRNSSALLATVSGSNNNGNGNGIGNNGNGGIGNNGNGNGNNGNGNGNGGGNGSNAGGNGNGKTKDN